MPTIISKVSRLYLACLILSTIARAQTSDPPKPAKEPVATIAGQPIYEDELQSAVTPKLAQLRNQEYQIKKQALDNLIDEKLIQAEAKKKGVSTDKLLEQEVDAKIGDPTDPEGSPSLLGTRTK